MGTRTRAVERSDLPTIHAWMADEELRDLLGTPLPFAESQHQQWYERVLGDRSQLVLLVERADDSKPIGVVGLRGIDLVSRNAEIWMYLGEESNRGQGHGREAFRAICSMGFDTLGLERIYARVFEFNHRALRFFEGRGMRREGLLRSAVFKRGRFWGKHALGLLASEFAAEPQASSSSASEVHRANIEFHTALAGQFNEKQPYYRPENRQRVQAIIEDLARRAPKKTLLDLGCGTGFIIEMAAPVFTKVVGIDITQPMLDRVPAFPNVETLLSEVEKTPFPSGSFGAATAYGLLHHLHDYRRAFAEIARCLAPGGVFYADESPNFYCAETLRSIASVATSKPLVAEVNSVVGDARRYLDQFGLDEQTVDIAMFQGKHRGGVREEEIVDALRSTGFSHVEFKYRWFLGQGMVRSEHGDENCARIHDYLSTFLPATRQLFKYVSVFATK